MIIQEENQKENHLIVIEVEIVMIGFTVGEIVEVLEIMKNLIPSKMIKNKWLKLILLK